MTHLRRLSPGVVLILLAVPAWGQDRRPVRMYSSAGAPPVSELVVASWYYERNADEAPRLVFLVLYRGQPQWYLRDPANDRHAAGGSTTASPDGHIEHGPLQIQHVVGGLSLPIIVDAAREVISVLDFRESLVQSNVFLIDRIDGVGGLPEVVRRLNVELNPATDLRGGGSPDIARIISRLPVLQAFVHTR